MDKLIEPWLTAGYEIFSQEGPNGLKVERLARIVGKSKSSFYHHFADLEIYTSFLLEYHMKQVDVLFEKEKACQRVVPDLLHILVEHKEDLLFNRQLRVHRSVPAFQKCFEKANQLSVESIVGIWAEALGLEHESYLAQMVLMLTMENFYLQITEETLTYEWLENYIFQLQNMVQAFKKGQVSLP